MYVSQIVTRLVNANSINALFGGELKNITSIQLEIWCGFNVSFCKAIIRFCHVQVRNVPDLFLIYYYL